jgi:hypothetical protein
MLTSRLASPQAAAKSALQNLPFRQLYFDRMLFTHSRFGEAILARL